VRERARGLLLTPFVLLLAAFQLLVYRYTGQRDLAIGSKPRA
jgi:non-ribosomal peptide synthetase component F